MKRLWLTFILGITLLTMAVSSSYAEFVYVTKAGKKYHHELSKYSQYDGVEKITLEEAVERGYEPSKSYIKIKEGVEEAAQEAESETSSDKEVVKKRK